MKQVVTVVALVLGLLAMSTFALASDVVIQCPLDPDTVVFGVQWGTSGRCQGEIGSLAADEGRTIRALLPSPTCFPTGAKGIRVSVGPGGDDRAPEGVFVAFNGAVTGEIDLYVKNDTERVTPELWFGMEWTCRQPQPTGTTPPPSSCGFDPVLLCARGQLECCN